MRHKLFAKTKHLILDMDGTCYLGDHRIPGAVEFVKSLKMLGLGCCFFSNNSSHARADCLEKLRRMGFPAEDDKVILSTHVASAYLRQHHSGARVYLLGNERMANELQQDGIYLVPDAPEHLAPEHPAPELILLGFDTTLNYEKICRAANWIAQGLPYYATHPDKNCPVAGGFMPDTGAMIALFEASAGRRPVVLGKPERTTVEYLCDFLHCQPDELCFVGDRLETDIAIGRHGSRTALVLTGVTTQEQYAAQNEIRADLTVNTLADLANYF